ncbi:hypothetical protein M1563_03150 [Patescibacteria group bacterium]|nr:hypothetical protein [Patescibacteria group bacterium]MCL5409787.1 hypothetical protein [Patescibacteria group bacterium]
MDESRDNDKNSDQSSYRTGLVFISEIVFLLILLFILIFIAIPLAKGVYPLKRILSIPPVRISQAY